MDRRPATRDEILDYYAGRRVQFETYTREVADRRTEHGVRHIRKATARVRNLNGIPTVRRLNEDFELFAEVITLDTSRSFVTCPTIITPR